MRMLSDLKGSFWSDYIYITEREEDKGDTGNEEYKRLKAALMRFVACEHGPETLRHFELPSDGIFLL